MQENENVIQTAWDQRGDIQTDITLRFCVNSRDCTPTTLCLCSREFYPLSVSLLYMTLAALFSHAKESPRQNMAEARSSVTSSKD